MTLVVIFVPDDIGDKSCLRVETGVVGGQKQKFFDLFACGFDSIEYKLFKFIFADIERCSAFCI